MTRKAKPPLGSIIPLHSDGDNDQNKTCIYCGQPKPWGAMEECDGPLPLRRDGSPFYDVRILHTWLKLTKYLAELRDAGYIEE